MTNNVRGRKILNVVFGVFLASIALYILFPRFGNELSCDSSVPTTRAQSIALADARKRKAAVCPDYPRGCQFALTEDKDGTWQISLYFVEKDFFAGCLFKGQDSEVFVYNRAGALLRVEGAPYE